MARVASQIHDECKEDESDNRDDLDTCEAELGLAVDRYGEDVQADHKDNDD